MASQRRDSESDLGVLVVKRTALLLTEDSIACIWIQKFADFEWPDLYFYYKEFCLELEMVIYQKEPSAF